MEQIFRLVEMSFRNNLVLCKAIVAMPFRDKFFMKNLTPDNISLTFDKWKPFPPIFFRNYVPPKVTFASSEIVFFNECFIFTGGNLFSV